MSGNNLSELNDHELMERAEQGTDRAFHVLFNRHYQKLLNYGVKFCGRRSLSEDALQRTFLYLYKKLDDYSPDAPLRALLFKVMRSELLYLLRKKRKEKNPDMDWDNMEEQNKLSDPSTPVQARESKNWIEEAVQQLPEHQREAVFLRIFEDFSYSDIARILDIPMGTVKSRLSQGLDQLQTIVKNNYPNNLPDSINEEL